MAGEAVPNVIGSLIDVPGRERLAWRTPNYSSRSSPREFAPCRYDLRRAEFLHVGQNSKRLRMVPLMRPNAHGIGVAGQPRLKPRAPKSEIESSRAAKKTDQPRFHRFS